MHICVGVTQKHTQGQLATSPKGQDHYEEAILPIGSTTEERGRVTCFLSVSFSPRARGASALGSPWANHPLATLNRPLINPSVGSLLHPQPSEEGSNPAKQTERRLRSWGAGEEEGKIEAGSDFSFAVFLQSQPAKEVISSHESFYENCFVIKLYCQKRSMI